ncbi:MAG: SurA N-terminal domain-containing protein [Bryobacterales bacterium]|nr:SurA N-terminal domain-containing protein [Bryobacterales bacterium]
MLRRAFHFVLVLAFAAGLRGELLDRIAITVGQDVITEQEIYEQLRIAAFLNGTKPEFTQQELRDTADRIVMQRLVLQDMKANGFALPTDEEVRAALAQSQQSLWGSATAFEQAAKDAGLPTEALKDFLYKMVATEKYIDFRFRPAVRVSDTAILERYQEKYNPLDPEVEDAPALEDVRQEIEEEITRETLSGVIDHWLEEARVRTGVQYKPEVLP